MSFGPASPDAGVELLRQLFLQCRACPKESGIVGNFTYWFSIQCPDGVVQVVSTRGVAVSITGCRLRIRLSWIFFYRQPNRQASTTCPPPPHWNSWTFWCSFLHIQENSGTKVKSCLILTSVWLPGWSTNVHTEARGRTPRQQYPSWVEGCVSVLAFVWGGEGRTSCWDREEGRSPRLWRWRGIFGHAHVAYLIDKGRAPLLLTWLTRGARPCCLLDWQGARPCCLLDWQEARPCCLLDWQGAHGRFGVFYFFFRASSWGLIYSFRSR